ncbi:Thioesterase/thiol ester dehydrase-isomerase [Melanomma pulvis-pyrius CBS 109.77]|uniref:Thioesterase/thiol ester dehydrase-isomerase n=1 Tax=Melanomma pulvis-pyrius CBS 109.77 TaxID=1314802 RepID=A0A6A6XVZ7_9PLEO|nr:Thioesterase/thiol ester dehydrase-isomerase [Melanomma pulvis-pyrius CBS 109.77]
MALEALKSRRREDYKFTLEYRTRWSDNDMYHHLNNSIYYFLFDSVVNTYLINHCGLHPPSSPQIGLVVHSHCDYFAPIEFPAVVDLALRVKKLGKSSVEYEIGVFVKGEEAVKAVGGFVHVFVERESRKPGVDGMGAPLREGLREIVGAGVDAVERKPKL